ncbi:MAG: transcription termination/antitermination NusG family protein [Bacteroidota bacterium]
MPFLSAMQLTRASQSAIDRLDTDEARWFAVRVGHKKERVAVAQLHKVGVTAYSPVLTEQRRYEKTGIRTVHFAVLPGYVFVQVVKAQEPLVYRCPYVFNFVRIGRERLDVPAKDIVLLQRITLEKTVSWQLQESEGQLTGGSAVMLVGGSLSGLRGTLVHRKNSNLFLVRIDSIGHDLEVEVDGKYLSVAPAH